LKFDSNFLVLSGIEGLVNLDKHFSQGEGVRVLPPSSPAEKGFLCYYTFVKVIVYLLSV